MSRPMKDSGVAWIGEIPVSWDIKTIRNLLIERNEKNRELSVKTILSLSAKSGVTLYSSENHSGNRPREDLSDYKIVRENDIVVNSMNILSGSVGLSKYTGVVSPVYYIYYPRENNNVQYLHFIFQCFEFQRSLRGLGNGILIKETESGSLNTIRMRIPSKKLSLQEFPSPPIEEQQKISSHLDSKCTQIDSLIANVQQQIEKLKAYKQSVITETVTKGLNPDAPMKDSGVEWIGEIPEHWEITKYGRICKVKSNLVHPENYPDYIQIAPDNIEKGSGKLLPCQTVKEAGVISDNHLFYKGQIIYSKIRPILNKVTIAPFDGLCSADMYPIETTQNYRYVLYYMLSDLFLIQVKMVTENRVKMPKINQEEISQIITVFPPIEEQNEIVSFLDEKCSQIDTLIALKQQKIEKLQQYKKSLIYEYVTGKREV